MYSCVIKCCNIEKLDLKLIKNSISVSSKINNSLKTDAYPLNKLKEYSVFGCEESENFVYFSYWILANGHRNKIFSYEDEECIF